MPLFFCCSSLRIHSTAASVVRSGDAPSERNDDNLNAVGDDNDDAHIRWFERSTHRASTFLAQDATVPHRTWRITLACVPRNICHARLVKHVSCPSLL